MATPTCNDVPASLYDAAGFGNTSALLWGLKWGGPVIGSPVAVTWSVAASTGSYAPSPGYFGMGETGSVGLFNAIEGAAAARALGAWDRVSGLSLQQVTEGSGTIGEVRFAYTGSGSMPGLAGHAYSPGTYPSAGDVWMQSGNWHADRNTAIVPGSWDYTTLLHEIGHALGLKHPFESTGENGSTLPARLDNYFYTVMSYAVKEGSDAYANFFPTTPMYLDVLAMRTIYGPDTVTNRDNTIYRFSDQQKYWQTIVDAGGNDRILYTGTLGATINLNEGAFSSLGAAISFSDGTSSRATVSIGPGTVIETAYGGSGNDRITGNAAHNTLRGNDGNDALSGGRGDDVLAGGNGSDRLAGGSGDDVFVFNTRPSATSIDRVTDFRPVDDTFRLENSVFKKLGNAGALKSESFWAGTNAHDENDRVIYNKKTGELSYDADGRGGAADVTIAWLPKKLAVKASDFWVV
jgi:serralysin